MSNAQEPVAPKCCVLCGTELNAESFTHMDAIDVIRKLGELFMINPDAPGVLIARTLFPKWSHRQIANIISRRRGCSHVYVGNVKREIEEYDPQLGWLMNRASPHTTAQRKRWAK